LQHLRLLRARLDLQIASATNQLTDYETAKKTNTSLGKNLTHIPKDPIATPGQRFWDTLSQHSKSVLDGISTGSNIPYTLSLVFMLTTTILTYLFPWTFFIIGGLSIAGGIVGYNLDKYYDNKPAINENRIEAAAQPIRQKLTYMNLLAATKQTEQAVQQALHFSPELDSGSNHLENANLSQTAPIITPPAFEGAAFPAGECVEAKRLRRLPTSNLIAKLARIFPSLLSTKSKLRRRNLLRFVSIIIPTLLSGKRGFDVISDIFYGIVFTTGITLAFTPFAMIGLGVGACYFANKLYRGVRKYQRIDDEITELSAVIPPIKYTYWQNELNLLGNPALLDKYQEKQDLHIYVQQNDVGFIAKQFEHQYRTLDRMIKIFTRMDLSEKSSKYVAAHKAMTLKLATIQNQLRNQTLVCADALNDSDRATRLRFLVDRIRPKPPVEKRLTFFDRLLNASNAVLSSLEENYKDMLRGFGLGTGIALTVFAVMEITSLIATMPYGLIIIGAGLGGSALKLLIRHFIKKPRWEESDNIAKARTDILDKEQLIDAEIQTKRLHLEATQLIKKFEVNPDEKIDVKAVDSSSESEPSAGLGKVVLSINAESHSLLAKEWQARSSRASKFPELDSGSSQIKCEAHHF
ncbi:MAG: hypothetical protein M3R00_09525, partial [Pseudomonadota bacterium]|nr:hypothetical protein [Pseudomonadota bacterium]